MKVWVVTRVDVEGASLGYLSVHSTEELALQEWEKHRVSLLAEYQELRKDGYESIYAPMIAAMSQTDPNLMDNSVHDEPVIREIEIDAPCKYFLQETATQAVKP
jgi:hypothetical protein